MLPQYQTGFPRIEPLMRPFITVSAGGWGPREYRYPTGKALQLRGRDTGSSGIKQRRKWGGRFISLYSYTAWAVQHFAIELL